MFSAVITSGQNCLVHSSCEAEFYAAVMAVAEGAHDEPLRLLMSGREMWETCVNVREEFVRME